MLHHLPGMELPVGADSSYLLVFLLLVLMANLTGPLLRLPRCWQGWRLWRGISRQRESGADCAEGAAIRVRFTRPAWLARPWRTQDWEGEGLLIIGPKGVRLLATGYDGTPANHLWPRAQVRCLWWGQPDGARVIDGCLRLDTPDGTWGLLGLDDKTVAARPGIRFRPLPVRRRRWFDPVPHWLATRRLLAAIDPGTPPPTGTVPSRLALAFTSGSFFSELLLPPLTLFAALMLLMGWNVLMMDGRQLIHPGLPLGLGLLAGLGSALALYRHRITAGYRAHPTIELALGVGALTGVALLVGSDAYDRAATSPPEPYTYQAVSPSEHWDLRYAVMSEYTPVDFVPDSDESPDAPAFTRAFLHGPEPGRRSVTLFLSRGPLGLWRVDRHKLDAAMAARDPEGQPRGGQCKDLSDGQETGEGEKANAGADTSGLGGQLMGLRPSGELIASGGR